VGRSPPSVTRASRHHLDHDHDDSDSITTTVTARRSLRRSAPRVVNGSLTGSEHHRSRPLWGTPMVLSERGKRPSPFCAPRFR
jgi:hypothetical protein